MIYLIIFTAILFGYVLRNRQVNELEQSLELAKVTLRLKDNRISYLENENKQLREGIVRL